MRSRDSGRSAIAFPLVTGLMEYSHPERLVSSRRNTNRLPVAPRPTLISWYLPVTELRREMIEVK